MTVQPFYEATTVALRVSHHDIGRSWDLVRLVKTLKSSIANLHMKISCSEKVVAFEILTGALLSARISVRSAVSLRMTQHGVDRS